MDGGKIEGLIDGMMNIAKEDRRICRRIHIRKGGWKDGLIE